MNGTKLTVTKLVNDSRQWYLIDGECPDTGVEFDNDQFAVCDDGAILDIDGCPLTPGDSQTIAVENAIEGFVRDQEKQSPPSEKTHCHYSEYYKTGVPCAKLLYWCAYHGNDKNEGKPIIPTLISEGWIVCPFCRTDLKSINQAPIKTIADLEPGDIVTDGCGEYGIVKTVPCGTAKYYANLELGLIEYDNEIHRVSDLDEDYLEDDEDDNDDAEIITEVLDDAKDNGLNYDTARIIDIDEFEKLVTYWHGCRQMTSSSGIEYAEIGEDSDTAEIIILRK